MRTFFSRFRNVSVILFFTFLLCFLAIIAIMASAYNYNWLNVMEKYQNDQLTVNAYKLIDDMKAKGLTTGPLNEEDRSWLKRRAILHNILIRYTDPDKKTNWFDMLEDDRFNVVLSQEIFPYIFQGQIIGELQVAIISQNELDPTVLSYRNMMKQRSLLLILASLVFSVIVSWFVAKLLSSHLKKLTDVAVRIRIGNWNEQAEVRGPEEIRQLAITLNELSRDLKKQEQWRRTLTEDLAHELRTPVTSVLSQLEAMIDGIIKPDQEWLQRMYDENMRLSQLVSDMERLSEAEASSFTMTVKKTDVVKLVQRVYRNSNSMAESKGVKLDYDGPNAPYYAEVDRNKMIQVLSNLVSNAIKYTPDGGRVTLSVDWNPDFTVFTCEDNGIGISEDHLPFIFNRFYRADKSRSRFSGGVGLGLNIAKALTDAHNGIIEVESCLGEGSLFRVIIPNHYKKEL